MPLSASPAPIPSTSADTLRLTAPRLMRQRRWRDDKRFQMRRIVILKNQDGEIVGYRPTIQQGTKEHRRDYYQTFKITPEVSLSEALRAAMDWRDLTEKKLGIDPGSHSAACSSKPIASISLIVSQSPPYRAHWATNQTADAPLKSGSALAFETTKMLTRKRCFVWPSARDFRPRSKYPLLRLPDVTSTAGW